ncbi:MAG: hypothetical protein PGN27_04295 [Mycolicibacterium neoaurum]|uniref:hypothetical protein n=1 Tax=Mycolicibacterium neoaurum TaxID=1795 RepID=UPI002FF708BF
MSEIDDVLDSEYRAFVRQLHERTIGVVAEIDRYWMRELFREVTLFASSVFDREFTDEQQKESWNRAMELQDKLQKEIEPNLNWLAYGHPDPDVRRAANVVQQRMANVIMYRDAMHAKRDEGRHATTAVQLVHSGMKDLRRVAYHAPFRVRRPEPEYDGIGVVEAVPSRLTDIPRDEY